MDALTKLTIERPVDRIDIKECKSPISAYDSPASSSSMTYLVFHYLTPLCVDGVDIWYPRHVSELDLCAHVCVKYEVKKWVLCRS